jgi:hypothetical protein
VRPRQAVDVSSDTGGFRSGKSGVALDSEDRAWVVSLRNWWREPIAERRRGLDHRGYVERLLEIEVSAMPPTTTTMTTTAAAAQ